MQLATIWEQVQRVQQELKQGSRETQDTAIAALQDTAERYSRKGVEIVDEELSIIFQNRISKIDFDNIVGKKCYQVYFNLDKPCEECIILNAINQEKSYSKISAINKQIYEIKVVPIKISQWINKVVIIRKNITAIKDFEKKVTLLKSKHKITASNSRGIE